MTFASASCAARYTNTLASCSGSRGRGEIRTDAAYVKSSKVRYVIAICVRRGADTRATMDNEALVTGAELSRIVYDYWNSSRHSTARASQRSAASQSSIDSRQ